MSYSIIKKAGSLLILLGLTSQVSAISPQANAFLQTPNIQSNAIEFARQAGAIAGFAKGCGQNLTDFNKRIAEAINKLATNPNDKAGAMLVYQQIAREAQINQQKKQTISCVKVLQDYQSLPIMQADYKEKVIAELNPLEP